MMTIMGIDPGLTGGFAIIDPDGVIIEPMPNDPYGKIDLHELKRLFSYYAPSITHCYIEAPGMRPRQRTQDALSVGKTFGTLEAMMVCLSIKYSIIQSRKWSEEFDHGVKEKNPKKRYPMIKVARRKIVAGLYPKVDLRRSEKCKVADSGMVDAILIATYGFNKHTSKGSIHHG
jgi:hypothetical protein